jgi:hypothetical protein
VADFCQCGNEPAGSIKSRELLDWLSDYQRFEEDSAPWRWLVHLLGTENRKRTRREGIGSWTVGSSRSRSRNKEKKEEKLRKKRR